MPAKNFKYLLKSVNAEKDKSAKRKQDNANKLFKDQTLVVSAAAVILGLGTSSLLREKVIQP